MTERICYKFEEFFLDPGKRSLLLNGNVAPLRPTAFDLLLVLVENHGQTLTKSEITKRVWGSDSGDDRKFHVTLHAVRQKLGDSAQTPRFIARDANGYRFVADVEQVAMGRDPALTSGVEDQILDSVTPDETSEQDARVPSGMEDGTASAEERVVFRQGDTGLKASRWDVRARDEGRQDACGPSKHLAHVVVGCSLYAALYAVALVLEISYEFNRYGSAALKISPLVFCWITITSFAGLAADRKLTSQGSASGLAVSAATFLIAAAILFAVLTRFLPSFPITQSTALQAYPAQAAYLKDISYFLILGFCFLMVPFHFIATVERDVARGRHSQVLGLLTGDKLRASPRGTIYPRFWALASLLVVLAAFSLVMTSRLLDHLKPGPYTNLFTQLVYVRGFLYFGLGIWCLIWYDQTIGNAKRKCRTRPGSK